MTRLQQLAVAAAALTLSGALHAAGFVRFATVEDVALQGGSDTAVPTLGDSFADLAQGAAFAAPPPEATAQVVPQPVTAPTTPPQITQPAVTAPPMTAPPMTAPVVTAPAASPAMSPAVQAAIAPMQDMTAITPVPDLATAAPAQSLRPQTRPQADPGMQARPTADRSAPRVAERRPDPAPPQQARATPQPQGNADRNAQRGAASGQQQAAATQAQARADRPAAQGDGGRAASASYGRAVLTQITRTRKERVPTRGRAVVAFAISDAGTLASVTVLRSSGSSDLDRVAVDHIRRAAPFPKPPAGAQRQFSFEFVGRS